ncbi:MAG: SRPBCC family protein [Solirubrobacterales bacterium]
MRLENEFTVPAPVERAWDVLLDVERVAPCLPGATLEGSSGDRFEGSMAVKIGPLTASYRGTVRIEAADEAARHAVLVAQARDARGDGTASATISTELEPRGAETLVNVVTDVQISGPAAQFGRGVMQDVSAKVMRQFAARLAAEMELENGVGSGARPAARGGASSAASAPGRAPAGAHEETRVGPLPLGPAGEAALAAAADGARREPRAEDVLDLGGASRQALLKRLGPVAAALVLVALAFAWGRRTR